MYVETLDGTKLWYDGENPDTDFRVQDFLQFEKSWRRNQQKLTVHTTVRMTIGVVVAALLWIVTENWLIGALMVVVISAATLRMEASMKKTMHTTFDPQRIFAQMLGWEIVDVQNNQAFALLNQALAERNPDHSSLDDYPAGRVSEVVPGYMRLAMTLEGSRTWWQKRLPNAHELANEAANRLLREAG